MESENKWIKKDKVAAELLTGCMMLRSISFIRIMDFPEYLVDGQ